MGHVQIDSVKNPQGFSPLFVCIVRKIIARLLKDDIENTTLVPVRRRFILLSYSEWFLKCILTSESELDIFGNHSL